MSLLIVSFKSMKVQMCIRDRACIVLSGSVVLVACVVLSGSVILVADVYKRQVLCYDACDGYSYHTQSAYYYKEQVEHYIDNT